MREWMLTAAGIMVSAIATGAPAQVMQVDETGDYSVVCASLPPAAPVAKSPTPYQTAILAAAKSYDLSPDLITAVIRQESDFNAQAVSPRGAIGLMQLLPSTAAELGVNPYDPTANIQGGAAYLRRQLDRFDGRLDLALAAYNAGAGAVDRYRGVPPYAETQTYVARNLDRLSADIAPQTPQTCS